MRLLMLCWLAVLALAGSPAHAALPARPDGPVLDAALIIPDDQEAALSQRLIAYNKKTGRALMVVTVTSLDGRVIESYTQDLARAWDVGGKESQEGLIFLIAPSERKIRIHPAVGVQGRVTDGFAGRTIREVIAPRFKAGDMVGGINAGVDALIAQMDRDPVDAKAVAEAADAAEAQRQKSQSSSGSAGSVVFWLFLILFLVLAFSRRGYRKGRRYRGNDGIDPGIILWGLSEVMHHASRSGGSDWGGGGGGGGGGGSDWGGFGGGGGGFDGGGASGDW